MGRTLVANRLLAASACGKRQRGRPLNAIVRCHLSDAPITVASYTHPTEAHIAKMKLESEGVPVFMLSDNLVSANWLLSSALGGIQLQVPPSEVSRAREILGSATEVDPSATCPACGSSKLRRSKFWWKVAFLAVHFLHIPLPFRGGALKCVECGHEME